ncbi:MAG: hypothetical protein IEMM0008_0411 [bacterium]|nr:MAG: hypothetical protein IEMM0008_0411 [bacterium]
MFSIEKNYITEQNTIIQSLKNKLEENKKQLISLENELNIHEKKSGNGAIDSEEFSSLEDVYTGEEDMLTSNQVSEDKLDQLLKSTDEEDVLGDWNDEQKEENSIDPTFETLDNDSPADKSPPPKAEFSLASIDVPAIYEAAIPRDIIARLQELNPDQLFRGKRKFVTLVQLNIHEVNQLSTQLIPEAYVKLYNKLFNQIFASVYNHKGMINQYFGEQVLAVFGLFDEDHKGQAQNAISCVQEITHKVQSINAYLDEKSLNPIHSSIAVHSGEVIVGKVGAIKETTIFIMGDEIKISGELVHLSKDYDFSPIISKSTKDLLGKSKLKKLPSHPIVGLKKKLTVYKL